MTDRIVSKLPLKGRESGRSSASPCQRPKAKTSHVPSVPLSRWSVLASPNLALRLIRVGTALIGVALLFSMWASPDRLESLPWFLLAMVGVVLVLAVTGPWLPFFAARLSTSFLLHFFLAAEVVALLSALLTSNWLAYKHPWLSRVYALLPTIRSLPFSWAKNGLAANQTGGMLAVLTAFAVVVAMAPQFRVASAGRRARLHRSIAIFLSASGAVVVFMTGSRTALVGLVIAVLVVLALRSSAWLWAWASGAVVVVIGLAGSGRLGAVFGALVRDQTLTGELISRLDIWSSSLKGIQDHAFTGIGLGVFNQVVPIRYPYATVALAFPVSQAHNLFLDVAASIGLPGLLGFLVLFAGLVLLAVQGLRRDYPTRVLSGGILASIVAFAIYGLTDSMSLSRPTSFILWLWPCALAISAARATAKEPFSPDARSSDAADGRAEHTWRILPKLFPGVGTARRRPVSRVHIRSSTPKSVPAWVLRLGSLGIDFPAQLRLWLLAGVLGGLVVSSVGLAWGAWQLNYSGILLNQVLAEPAVQTSPKAQAELTKVMNLTESALAGGLRRTSWDTPLLRTYAAAAKLEPSDAAYTLLLNAFDAGRLDRSGQLALGQVATATGHWQVAKDIYTIADGSNLLTDEADTALAAGKQDVAVHKYDLAYQSIDSAVKSERSQAAGKGIQISLLGATSLGKKDSERAGLLYRIGRGLLAAGQPVKALAALEEARTLAAIDSPGAAPRQSLTFCLAQALVQTMPDQPTPALFAGPDLYAMDPSVSEFLRARDRIESLVIEAVGESHTVAADITAGQIVAQVGDYQRAIEYVRAAIDVDSRSAPAYTALVAIYQQIGLLAQARDVAAEGAKNMPNDVALATSSAILSYQTMPSAQVLPRLERAATLKSADPYLYAYLGDCYLSLGRPVDARVAYLRGLERAPQSSLLIGRLKQF